MYQSAAASGTPRYGQSFETGLVRIRPNRNRLDSRFRSLGFTVFTGGKPFFEVILATDKKVFDPANLSARSKNNYYSSRQDSGLLRSTGPNDLYLVPGAALSALTQMQPTEIFFTVAAYSSSDGKDAEYAIPIAQLVKNAPSVAVARDFSRRGVEQVMGISFDKLRRFHGGTPITAAGYSLSEAIDPRSDASEGEDGFHLAPIFVGAEKTASLFDTPISMLSNWRSTDDEFEYEESYSDEDASGGADDYSGENDDNYSAPYAAQNYRAPAPRYREHSEEDEVVGDSDYDDGFGDEFDAPSSETAPDNSNQQSYSDEADNFSWEDVGLDYQPLDAAVVVQDLVVEPSDCVAIIGAIAQLATRRTYGTINADDAFNGRLGANHPAVGRYHEGLSYGIVPFNQDAGQLGELLRRMQTRDARAFDQNFAPYSTELLRITTATGPASRDTPSGRSVRVQPVAGSDLWQPAWTEKFVHAANNADFQAEQNRYAAELFIAPMLPLAARFGLDTPRSLIMIVMCAMHMGVSDAQRFLEQLAKGVSAPTREALIQALVDRTRSTPLGEALLGMLKMPAHSPFEFLDKAYSRR
jgi:hypothetical protein